MAIEIMPRVGIQPVRSQTGGVQGRVVPMQDQTGATLRAIGEGAQDLGRATTAAADTFQDQQDIAQSMRMRNLYDAEVQAEMQDPERGFLTARGMDANNDRRKQSFDRLKAQREKIGKMAQNEAQKMNFAVHADEVDARSVAHADRHQENEVKNFRAGETKVSAEIGIRRGIELVGTDEGEIAVMGAMRDLDSLADLYGWPKDSNLRAKLKQDATDALHSGVIGKFTQDPQNAPAAATYLSQHRGEMSPNALTKAVDEVRQAMRVGKQQQIDAAAWAAASNLAESGLPLEGQRADIDRGVRMGLMTPEVAMKTWALVQNFSDQKWQDLQRERASTKQQLEQDFAKNPDLGVDMLPTDIADKIDRLGLRSDAMRIHRDVRLNRLADQVGDGSLESLVLSRDMRSIGEMRQMVEFLEQRASSIVGEEAKTPAGAEKKRRLQSAIQKTQSDIEALLMRPRTMVPVTEYPSASAMPITTGATPVLPQDAARQNEEDMKKLIEAVRNLYPGARR